MFLIINTTLNILIQIAIIFALQFAVKANMSIGLVTALFSVNTLSTPILFFFLFKEKLGSKAVIAILLVVVGIILGAIPRGGDQTAVVNDGEQEDTGTYQLLALGMSILVPIFNSFFYASSRQVTAVRGYKSRDLTMDTFLLLGLIETPVFILYHINKGYTTSQLIFGIGASILDISAIFLGIYAATYGLAGPTVAIQQITSIVIDTILGIALKGQYPDLLGLISILSLMVAAVIMSVQLPGEKKSDPPQLNTIFTSMVTESSL